MQPSCQPAKWKKKNSQIFGLKFCFLNTKSPIHIVWHHICACEPLHWSFWDANSDNLVIGEIWELTPAQRKNVSFPCMQKMKCKMHLVLVNCLTILGEGNREKATVFPVDSFELCTFSRDFLHYFVETESVFAASFGLSGVSKSKGLTVLTSK